MYDIVIVGAGIAGLTAAIYGRRAGKKVLVLEKGVYGGQIINTLKLENWPGMYNASGMELMQKIHEQAVGLGAEVEIEQVEEIIETDESLGENDTRKWWLIKTEDDSYKTKTVIIAVGAENRKLGLENEESLIGRGISYCATCDGAFFKQKDVAIIGGGNTALDDALYLSDICNKVYLVHRRDEFRGAQATAEKLRKRKNVEMVLGYIPAEIIGDKKVTGLKLAPSGRVPEVKADKTLDVEGIFVAIGQTPGTDKFRGLVELDDGNYVSAGEDCKTMKPGIFVAGDCRKKIVRQLVTAAADGAVAASAAVDYLA